MENTNYSLINVDSLSNVAIKFLDMIENAVGWCVRPKGKRKDFEEGVELYKKDIEHNDELTSLERAAFYAKSREIVKQYTNQGKIVAHALTYIDNKSHPNIDEDWLQIFFDYAKNISNERIQILWGKILAEKYNGNTSINRKLIQCLSLMDAESAELFEDLCEFSIQVDIYGKENRKFDEQKSFPVPIILNTTDYMVCLLEAGDDAKEYIKRNLSKESFILLEEIGLINITYEERYFQYHKCLNCLIKINNQLYRLHCKDEQERIIELSNIRFSLIGQTLYHILSIPSNPCLNKIVISFLNNNGYQIEKI